LNFKKKLPPVEGKVVYPIIDRALYIQPVVGQQGFLPAQIISSPPWKRIDPSPNLGMESETPEA